MTDELPIRATLGEFYMFLEREGYIDEEVENSPTTRDHMTSLFINTWPSDRTPLAGTNRALALEREAAAANPDHESLKNITDENRSNASPKPDLDVLDPDFLLMRAHENMDMYTSDGHRNMRPAILAENFALLAIAGYLKKICEQ